MSAPKRIQRKRTKGWRMPEGAVYVGRPSKWGNPCDWTDYPARVPWGDEGEWYRAPVAVRKRWAYVDFKSAIGQGIGYYSEYPSPAEVRSELRGRDLACWCPLDQPCHADVLLEVANQ